MYGGEVKQSVTGPVSRPETSVSTSRASPWTTTEPGPIRRRTCATRSGISSIPRRAPAEPLGHDQRGAEAGERVQDQVARLAQLLDELGDQ